MNINADPPDIDKSIGCFEITCPLCWCIVTCFIIVKANEARDGLVMEPDSLKTVDNGHSKNCKGRRHD